MAFTTHSEFKQFLDGASVALTGHRASTHKTKRIAARPEASDIGWWRSTGRLDGTSEGSLNRNRAYLLSYFEAGGSRVPAEGIALGDGHYIGPDRSVIERSLRDGHIEFDARTCSFTLTPVGESFLYLVQEQRC